FASCRGKMVLQLPSLSDLAYTSPAAASHRLDQNRKAKLFRLSSERSVRLVLARIAWETGDSGSGDDGLRFGLIPHSTHDMSGRADEHEPSSFAGLRKCRIFCEEAIAGMD